MLATSGVGGVLAATRLAQRLEPAAKIVLGVAEVDAWRYRNAGFERWTLGEDALVFDPAVCEAVRQRGFELLVVPLGLPREGFASLAALVRARPAARVLFVGPAGLRVRSPRLARAWLWALTVALHFPIRLAMRVARTADGAGLLALQALARARRARRDPVEPTAVCHVVSTLGTGGAQRQLVEYLRRKAPASTRLPLLVLTDSNDLFRSELEACGVPVETVYDRLRRSRLRHIFAYLFPRVALTLALTARLEELRPALVWSWLLLANVMASTAARLAGVPRVITSVRNLSEWKAWPEYRHWWYRPADRGAAALSDVVVVNARALADDYARWANASPRKIRVVPNGVDVERLLAAPWRDLRAEYGLAPDAVVVLTLGRLAAEKNHALLLRASARLAAAGVPHVVVVVGHGVLEPALRTLAADLGIAASVVFAGKTTEPQSWYRSADVFALPSRVEGMPNALMEAQAFGLPAVTTAAGGASEVVEDARTGFVVPVGDEAAFAAALRQLLTDKKLRGEMGSAARHRMRHEFALDRTVAAMEELLVPLLPWEPS